MALSSIFKFCDGLNTRHDRRIMMFGESVRGERLVAKCLINTMGGSLDGLDYEKDVYKQVVNPMVASGQVNFVVMEAWIPEIPNAEFQQQLIGLCESGPPGTAREKVLPFARGLMAQMNQPNLFAWVLVTAQPANYQSPLNEYPTASDEVAQQMLFQMAFTIRTCNAMQLMHNDLLMTNWLVGSPASPVAYAIDAHTVYVDPGAVRVYLYDWDRAYSAAVGPNYYLTQNQNFCAEVSQCNAVSGRDMAQTVCQWASARFGADKLCSPDGTLPVVVDAVYPERARQSMCGKLRGNKGFVCAPAARDVALSDVGDALQNILRLEHVAAHVVDLRDPTAAARLRGLPLVALPGVDRAAVAVAIASVGRIPPRNPPKKLSRHKQMSVPVQLPDTYFADERECQAAFDGIAQETRQKICQEVKSLDNAVDLLWTQMQQSVEVLKANLRRHQEMLDSAKTPEEFQRAQAEITRLQNEIGGLKNTITNLQNRFAVVPGVFENTRKRLRWEGWGNLANFAVQAPPQQAPPQQAPPQQAPPQQEQAEQALVSIDETIKKQFPKPIADKVLFLKNVHSTKSLVPFDEDEGNKKLVMDRINDLFAKDPRILELGLGNTKFRDWVDINSVVTGGNFTDDQKRLVVRAVTNSMIDGIIEEMKSLNVGKQLNKEIAFLAISLAERLRKMAQYPDEVTQEQREYVGQSMVQLEKISPIFFMPYSSAEEYNRAYQNAPLWEKPMMLDRMVETIYAFLEGSSMVDEVFKVFESFDIAKLRRGEDPLGRKIYARPKKNGSGLLFFTRDVWNSNTKEWEDGGREFVAINERGQVLDKNGNPINWKQGPMQGIQQG